MSATTATAPTVVRSSSRRQQSYASPTNERHQQTPSSTTRSPTTPEDLHRSESHSHSHSHSHTRRQSSSQQTPLAGVARRDYETSNLARPPSSRRSSERDRSHPAHPPNTRTESTRSTHRSSSRPGHSRYSSDMSNTTTLAATAGPTPVPPSSTGRTLVDAAGQGSAGPVKRRTTIGTQTGQWSLGKTIGAGSMGKVKLAKNLETGEQARAPNFGLVNSNIN